MNVSEENKIQKLLELFEELDVLTKRMIFTCEELERALRGRLNEDELPPAA